MSTQAKETNNNKTDAQKSSMNRSKKPSPLNLNQAPPLLPPPQLQPMPIDDLLELMTSVTIAVRNNQFGASLQAHIVRLCSQLRMLGESLECTHPNELNRCFVALRQACCRDQGALGTGCRLKIMELIELRAQAWRANFSHSHYYMQRGALLQAQLVHALRVMPQYALLAAQGAASSAHHAAQASGKESQWDALLAGNGPTSAPPFGVIPINPFGPPGQMPPMPMIGPDGSPSYYLVPATAGFMPPAYGIPPGSPNFGTPKTPSSIETHPPLMDTPWPKGAVIKPSPRSLGPTKIDGKNQLRDEIVIRNADSGKIMGVKGRRVAVVEEISKTVISFAKVPATAKDRTLTITGDTEEVIAHAKLLIEETIKRNVSPNRADGSFADTGEVHDYSDDEDEEDEDQTLNLDGIKFERNPDGTLRVSSDDPLLLEAAQEALSSFVRKTSQPVHIRRKSENKDRRKSESKSITTSDIDESTRKKSDADSSTNWRLGANSPKGTRDRFAGMDGNPVPLVRAIYTRDYLLKVQAELPKDIPCPTIVEECDEIMRK